MPFNICFEMRMGPTCDHRVHILPRILPEGRKLLKGEEVDIVRGIYRQWHSKDFVGDRLSPSELRVILDVVDPRAV